MGKNKNKNENYSSSMDSIRKKEKELANEIRKIKIPCSHTNAKGKLKVDFLRGNLVECRKCGLKFDFGKIEIKDLDASIMVIHNAINQIKALTDNPEEDVKIIKELGQMDYNLTEIRELYKRTLEGFTKGNKKKKKHHDNDDFGSYGVNNLNLGRRKSSSWY